MGAVQTIGLSLFFAALSMGMSTLATSLFLPLGRDNAIVVHFTANYEL
jgi:hypothetical protein